MYVRFEGTSYDCWSRGYCGVFQTAGDIDKTALNSWHLDEIKRECAWFNDNLSFPRRLFYRPNSKAEISGLCWFLASADEYVNRARYLAWLLNDLGVLVVERKSWTPGRVLWQDDHQIVAVERLAN